MIRDRIESLSSDEVSVVVVEAALLIEAKWTPLADEVWVVTTPQERVLSRLTGRGMSREQALARIESQMPQDERVTHADVVIANGSGMNELESSIAETWNSRVSARKEG
jgi:dephospho-CoA kinase